MLKYILKRLLEAIPVLLIISTLTFFMLRLAPGGPFDQEKALPDEVKEKIEAFYGLDQPLHTQYLKYLGNLMSGDLGPSFKYPGWSVNEIIAQKLPISVELGVYALVIAITFGVIFGVIAALRHNTFWDYFPMSASMFGICLPSFVIGPVLILIFAINLKWFNSSGWYHLSDRVLPAITLSAFYMAYIARLTRGSMLDILKQDFIRTAQAKGLSLFKVSFVHAFRNALSPIISYLGPAIAGIITGSFVIETVFNIPGLGKAFVQAAFNRDYTMVLGTVLLYASMIIVFNLIADILLVWLNPRQKFN